MGVYYFVSGQSFRPQEAEIGALKLLNLSAGDVVMGLEIENRTTKEKVSLGREVTGWRLRSPVVYPAENFLVEGMVSALTMSQRVKRFPADEDEPGKEYGLDSPGIRIGIETEADPVRRYLLIGDDSPVGAGVYARWEGEKEYFLIPSEVKASFERSVYSLRQKKLFEVDWDAVSWMEVKIGEKKFRLEKAGEVWYWVNPSLQSEIPAEKAVDLIYAFRSLYVKEFLDGTSPSRGRFGFRRGGDFLSLGLSGGEGEKLALGDSVPGKDAFYAHREKEDLVILVSRENIRSLVEAWEVNFHEMKENVDSDKT